MFFSARAKVKVKTHKGRGREWREKDNNYRPASLTNTNTGTYVVLVPDSISPNTDLTLTIQLLSDAPGRQYRPTSITATLLDSQNMTVGTPFLATVSPRVTFVTASIQVPPGIKWDRYQVEVIASGGYNFKNRTNVWFRSKSVAIFVQTDKAVYKPGDTVRFRAFIVDAGLKPLSEKMNINIYDSQGNKIAEDNDVIAPNGFSGSLVLSTLVQEGQWRIVVTLPDYDNMNEYYYFTVEDYVLPKFDVSCDIPDTGKVTDTAISGSATATYNFGKPVQGQLIVTLTVRYGSGFFDVQGLRTEVPIDGTAQFSFPMELVRRLTRNLDYETFQVECTVVEPLTRQNYSSTDTLQIRKSNVQLEFYPNQPTHFKADVPYPIVLKASLSDDTPLPPTTDQVKVGVTYFTDKPLTGPLTVSVQNYDLLSPFALGDTIFLNDMFFDVAEDGTVQFDLTIPNYVATVKVKAEFREETTYLDIQKFRSTSEAVLNVEFLNTEPLKVGQSVQGQLSATDSPVTVTYLVLSKGRIVYTRNVELPRNQKYTQFEFPVTSLMSPTARIIAYYVRTDGEIIADALNFAIEDLFQNKVEVTFDKTTEVEPAEEVSLNIRADPNSVVNVLVSDKSVRLLKSGNDITQSRVRDELNRFGSGPVLPRDSWGIILPWRPRADDSCDLLNDQGLNMMTDAHCLDFNLWQSNRVAVFGRSGAGGGRAVLMSADENMSLSPSGGSAEPPRVRKLFPETFIWTSVITDAMGRASIPATVPDTIGQWQGSAFALNSETGLGVAPQLANLTVVRPFFINLMMPTQVVRGEEMVLQVIVFNYFPGDITAKVVLKGSDQFSIVTYDAAGVRSLSQVDESKCLVVPSSSPIAVYFVIVPEKIGNIEIEVSATETSTVGLGRPANVGDAVRRPLKVKAEGEVKQKNIPFLVSHKGQSETFEATVSLQTVLPPAPVPDSLAVQVTVTGDLFGKSLKALDTLIQLPYGCGEQNMLKFAPAIFAAKYLQATGRLEGDAPMQAKIRKTLTTGYQRQLIYVRGNGSFSAFGNADDEGSNWLTAFVVKSFAQAKRLGMVYIDPSVVEKAVKYILDNQEPSGAFRNTGLVNHKAMQGGSNANIRSLTAYVLIALQEVKLAEFVFGDDFLNRRINFAIAEGVAYLTREIPEMTTSYEFAISAYALSLSASQDVATLLSKLDAKKIVDGREVHWPDDSYALQIEIASYALLTYAKENRRDDGLGVLFWLVENRNPWGGYSSTQDTVVALQALSEFAVLIYSNVVDMSISVTSDNVEVGAFTLTSQNHDILQFVDVLHTQVNPDSILTIQATGAGLALIEVTMYFNVIEDPDPPSYDLFLTVLEDTPEFFSLQACSRFTVVGKESNMAIMDIGFPSGFEPVVDTFVKPGLVKRTETVGSRFMIYFDKMPDTNTCVTVNARRAFIVGNPKPALVFVYSYYEPNERVSQSYLPPSLISYDLCDKCGPGCTSCATSLDTVCA